MWRVRVRALGRHLFWTAPSSVGRTRPAPALSRTHAVPPGLPSHPPVLLPGWGSWGSRGLCSSGGGGTMFAAYESLVAGGRLRGDPSQEMAAALLEMLQRRAAEEAGAREAQACAASAPPPPPTPSKDEGKGAAVAKKDEEQDESEEEGLPPPPVVLGAYLWGPVGSGKSMLMDLYHATMAAPRGKRRAHFHEFMLDVHRRLHRLHSEVPKATKLTKDGLRVHRYDTKGLRDPLLRVADEIAGEVEALCLDEMQVTDVADAMILKRLFASLLERGVVVVFTSNRPPGDLYKGGLSWDYFKPFIDLVEADLEVFSVGKKGVDYRLMEPAQSGALGGAGEGLVLEPPKGGGWHVGAEAGARLEDAWAGAVGGGAPGGGEVVRVESVGRQLAVPRGAAPRACWFRFEDLCSRARDGSALGPADFVALAGAYSTVVVEGVPRLSPRQRDAGRRFVTLVDALYESRAALVCSAECPPEDVFGELAQELVEARRARAAPGAGGASDGSEVGPGGDTPLQVMEEEAFMHRRAVSRLREMSRGAPA